MTKEWEPEHYVAFALVAVVTVLLLGAEFVSRPALSYHLLTVALWGLPVILALALSASLRTGIVTMKGLRTERQNSPFTYWLLIAAQTAMLAFLIITFLSRPLWNRH